MHALSSYPFGRIGQVLFASCRSKKPTSGFRLGIGLAALLAALFGLGAGFQGTGWEGTWHDALVQRGDVPGGYHALCVDAAGRPRIAFTVMSSRIFRYAAWTGSAWKFSKIANDPDWSFSVAHTISMALTPSGTPHVAYFDAATSRLMYAVYNGATWSNQVVDGSLKFQCGEQNAIALDSQNRPHIFYTVFYDDTLDVGLRYASWNGASWVITTVSTGGVYDQVEEDAAVSLAIDGAGRAHAAYVCGDERVVIDGWYADIVRYATSTSGAVWSKTDVDVIKPYPDYFSNTYLKLDSAGNPHVAATLLVDRVNNALRYASRSAGGWSKVASIAKGVPGQLGFMLSGDGRPAAAYGDMMSFNLVFGAQVGKAWVTEKVKKTGTTGSGDCRLALGPDGRAFLSYYYINTTLNQSELRLAQAAPGLWPGVPLPGALDCNGKWQTGGSQSWLGQTSETHDGVDAARPDVLGHNQSSWLSIAVQGPAKISFWWKTSSEKGDKLGFYVDATAKATLSGIGVWKQKTFDIVAGDHVVKWEFKRNASGSAGLDTGFVDQVKITK